MQNTEEIRCGTCRRKLGQGHYVHLTIKCPSCRAVNTLRATALHTSTPASVETQTDDESTNQLFDKR